MPHEMVLAEGILRIRFSGVLTPEDLAELAPMVIALEREHTVTPHRISDLSEITSISVAYEDMSRFVRVRTLNPPKNPIRSAIVAATAIQLGYARMFQTLNDHPLVKIEIFPDVASAEAWIKGA